MSTYLALTPRVSQSGEQDPELRITKAGNGFLQRLLVQAAHSTLGPFGDGHAGFTDIGGGIADLDEGLRGPLLHLLRRWTPQRKARGRRGTSGIEH